MFLLLKRLVQFLDFLSFFEVEAHLLDFGLQIFAELSQFFDLSVFDLELLFQEFVLVGEFLVSLLA